MRTPDELIERIEILENTIELIQKLSKFTTPYLNFEKPITEETKEKIYLKAETLVSEYESFGKGLYYPLIMNVLEKFKQHKNPIAQMSKNSIEIINELKKYEKEDEKITSFLDTYCRSSIEELLA